jgi:hypothetical protein
VTAPHIQDNWKVAWRNRICDTEGCYNAPAKGYICCPACLWGAACRADDAAIRAKKREEKSKEPTQ